MFIKFFKSNSPASYIILPLFAMVLWISGSWGGQDIVVQNSMPFYEMLAQPFSNMPFLATSLAFLLVIGEAFLLNFIVNENEVLSGQSFLPALFYIVYMSNDKSKLMLHPMLFANLFILLAIYKLISSYRKNNAFSQAFDTGLLLSIATLFYLPSIVFLPLIGIGLIIFRPFNWREWVISFLGVIVPFLFVLMYYFWYDSLTYLLSDKIFYSIFVRQPKIEYSFSYYFMIGVGWFIVFISIGKLFNRTTGAPQRTKNGILLFIWIFVLAILSVIIAPELSTKSLSFLAFPASVFCANYFLKLKKQWWGECLFMLLLSAILVHHFL